MSNESALKALLAPEAATVDPTAQSTEETNAAITDSVPAPTASNSDGLTAPMAAALEFLEGYLQSLQYKDQRTAINRYAASSLQVYATYYNESKSILKAMEDATYCPNSCKVKINFQPMDIIAKSPAYQALSDKMDDVETRMNTEIGKLWIQGRIQNNNGLKSYQVKLFAKALALFAKLFLAETDAESYGAHDLVAELLLRHHKAILFHFDNISVASFVEIYREVNNVGHKVESARELMDHLCPPYCQKGR